MIQLHSKYTLPRDMRSSQVSPKHFFSFNLWCILLSTHAELARLAAGTTVEHAWKFSIWNFQLENFIHPDYSEVLEAPMVDSRILKSSIEFRKYCKKLLLEDQQEFIRIVKKGKKD